MKPYLHVVDDTQSLDDMPPCMSFVTALGPMNLSFSGGDSFLLLSGNLGLTVICERRHIAVERWPAMPEIGEPAGANFYLRAEGGFQATFMIDPEEAAQLAWFAGVKLQEGAIYE